MAKKHRDWEEHIVERKISQQETLQQVSYWLKRLREVRGIGETRIQQQVDVLLELSNLISGGKVDMGVMLGVLGRFKNERVKQKLLERRARWRV